MNSLPAALAALFLIWAAGFGATVWLTRSSREIEWLELSALAWFIGTAVVSLTLWLVSFSRAALSCRSLLRWFA